MNFLDPYIDRLKQDQGEEYDRLLKAAPVPRPSVGDRVLVAAGLLGRGFCWIRKEGEVVEVAQSACRVRFDDASDPPREIDFAWVVWPLVTDILGPKEES